MKNKVKIFSALLITGTVFFAACKKSDDTTPTPAATVYYQQADAFGRPAINTVFNAAADKDAFNTTTIAAMGAIYQPKFLANVVALDTKLGIYNPAYVHYSTNALGWDPTTLTTALATDVLNVSTTGATTLGTLSGRRLDDDAIDIELKYVVFGGPDGTKNPGLTSDNVNANDKAFLTTFPYEASPW